VVPAASIHPALNGAAAFRLREEFYHDLTFPAEAPAADPSWTPLLTAPDLPALGAPARLRVLLLAGNAAPRLGTTGRPPVFHAVFHRYLVLRSGWEWEVPDLPRDFAVGSIMADFAAAMRWLHQGRVCVEGLATTELPADGQRVWQDLLHQRHPAPTVVFDWRAYA
jgi:hypothetical protein